MLKLTTIALALALLGCGSSTSSSIGNFSNSSVALDSSARQLTVEVPPGGGTVTLPRTQNIAGTLTFAPGAAPGTVLTLQVTENAPPGTAPDTTTGPVQRDAFYYILFGANKPFDFALLKSTTLTEVGAEGPVKARAIANDAEVYQAELSDYTQGSAVFAQGVEGFYDESTDSTVLSQPEPLVMQPGSRYLLQAKAIQTEKIEVTITNNSGVDTAYFCVLGQNPNPANVDQPDPNYYRVSESGQMVPFAKSDRTIGNTTDPNGKVDGYTELYNIPIKGGSRTFQLPQMAAGRMYISLGRKMQIRLEDYRDPLVNPPAVHADVLLAQPNGWTNPGDPNYRTLFDWLEFDYKVNDVGGGVKQAGIGINKTEVDMMGFGIQFEVNGPTIGNSTTNPPAPIVGTTNDGRAKIFEALGKDSSFKKLIVPGPVKVLDDEGRESEIDVPLRCIAPVKGLENSFYNRPEPTFQTFDLTYFDEYLTRVWQKYKSEDLECYTSAFGTWYGRVDANDKMVFTCVQTGTGQVRPGFDQIYVRKPSTTNAFEPTELITSGGITYKPDGVNFVPVPQPGPSDVPPAPDSTNYRAFTKYAATEIVAAMSAAMNRTTLLLQPRLTRNYREFGANLTKFYLKEGDTTRINEYAKAIHDHSLPTNDAPGPTNTTLPSNGGGAAYAFGFDDNSNQSSYLSELNSPTKINITLTKLRP